MRKHKEMTLLWATALSALMALTASGAEPTAHDPQFENKKVWADLSGKEGFVGQKWETLPVYVWAHPGKSALDRAARKNAIARKRDPGPDRDLPENWLVNGKPATTMPAGDKEVDLVLPASDAPYVLAAPDWRVRHVTIERGATLSSHMKVEAIKSISGNLWVKKGAAADMFSFAVVGPNHAFFRNDNPASSPHGKGQDSGNYLAYWITIAKPKGSVEWLGDFRMGDELKFNEGTTIVGPNSRLQAGPPSTQIIGPEAVLELQSGALFGKHTGTGRQADILVLGELRAGSPQRPITSDATLGLNGKSERPASGQVNVEAALAKANVAEGGINKYGGNSLTAGHTQKDAAPIPGGYSLAVSPAGRLSVHSVDPAKARLRLAWNGAAGRGSENGADKVVIYLFSDNLALDGVVFDNFYKGGINLLKPEQRSKWKNVVFGEKNEGQPDELFTYLQAPSPGK